MEDEIDGVAGGCGRDADSIIEAAKWVIVMIVFAAVFVFLSGCAHDLPLLR